MWGSLNSGRLRRHDFVDLDGSTITAMLQPVFPGSEVVSAALLTDGYVNTNYRVWVSGVEEAVVLRVYVRDAAACRKDLDIYSLVSGRVPVPELLYADPEGSLFGGPYAVMRWVDGVMLNEVLAVDGEDGISEAARAVGEALAAIGSHTFPRSGFFGPGLEIADPFGSAGDSLLSYIEGCLFRGRAGQRLGAELTARVWDLVTGNASRLAGLDGMPSLVHSDFNGSNILMSRESGHWRTAAVLDWEFAHSGSSLFDIGIMLRHDRTLHPAFEPGFISGFVDGGGGLPVGWKQLTKLLDLLNLCELLDSPTGRGSLVTEAAELVAVTVTYWDEYGARKLDDRRSE